MTDVTDGALEIHPNVLGRVGGYPALEHIAVEAQGIETGRDGPALTGVIALGVAAAGHDDQVALDRGLILQHIGCQEGDEVRVVVGAHGELQRRGVRLDGGDVVAPDVPDGIVQRLGLHQRFTGGDGVIHHLLLHVGQVCGVQLGHAVGQGAVGLPGLLGEGGGQVAHQLVVVDLGLDGILVVGRVGYGGLDLAERHIVDGTLSHGSG